MGTGIGTLTPTMPTVTSLVKRRGDLEDIELTLMERIEGIDAEVAAAQAERELDNETTIRRLLVEAELEYEAGRLDEAEFEAIEDEYEGAGSPGRFEAPVRIVIKHRDTIVATRARRLAITIPSGASQGSASAVEEGIAEAEVKLRHGQRLAATIGRATRRRFSVAFSGRAQGERLVRWRGIRDAQTLGTPARAAAAPRDARFCSPARVWLPAALPRSSCRGERKPRGWAAPIPTPSCAPCAASGACCCRAASC